MAEIFFGILARQAIRRGTFHSVADLKAAIGVFTDAYNERARPCIWARPPTTHSERPKANKFRTHDISGLNCELAA